MNIDINYFKNKLESEKADLEQELVKLPRPEEGEPEFNDEIADRLENKDEEDEVKINFAERLREIDDALAKIVDGRYGVCEISGEEIELDRLEANPAARTCKKHLNVG